jgi:hypothetical protein
MNDEHEPLLRTSEARQSCVSLPVLISNRLDRLVKRLEREGIQTSRKDLIAALVLAAPEQPEALLTLSLRYGKATTKDAALHDEPDATVLNFDRQKPGRRPRTA